MIATSEILTQAFTETLETMAFCSVDAPDEETLVPNRLVHVEMDYRGPRHGHLQILGGWELGRLLAENIGCLEEVDDESVLDAWKEICNVMSGLVIPALADNQGDIYDITVPVAKTDSESPSWQEFISQPETQVVNVEGRAVAAQLSIDECEELNI